MEECSLDIRCCAWKGQNWAPWIVRGPCKVGLLRDEYTWVEHFPKMSLITSSTFQSLGVSQNQIALDF
jgi:hypothetical protein